MPVPRSSTEPGRPRAPDTLVDFHTGCDSSRGHHDDCHQPLNVNLSRSARGLTVVTKCADLVVTLKSTSVLNDAGKVATAWSY